MLSRLREFFFPSTGFSRKRFFLFMSMLGVFAAIPLLTIPPAWEYSNSAQFCGTTCHTMPPEYNTYLVSPHARVPCVDCHIGRDLLAIQFYRKIGHTRLVFATLFDEYEYPIHTGEMRPARDTCEQCHFPEKFSNDTLRVIETFSDDRENTPYDIYLLMHTGGGSEREGLAQGIHWHVEKEISFIALDSRQQEIPWVQVKETDGSVTTYTSINSPLSETEVKESTKHEVDCLTCHNRISHLIKPPSDLVDDALAVGDISRKIPFIRTMAIDVLGDKYASFESAKVAFSTLDTYYKENYPDFYAEDGQELVAKAIGHLNSLYEENNYPDQLLNWETHPNNVGHKDWPGCFRCHDGQHFSEEGEAIRLECNLCHSIPVVVTGDEIEPMLPIATGLEPESHLDSTWITRHHNELDITCSNCHDVSNPGGVDNSSFCANSVCHGEEWRYAGFDAPGLATMLGFYHVEPIPLLQDFEGAPTYAVLEPLFVQACSACHGRIPSKGLRVTDYESIMAGGESGPIIVSGDPDASLIVETLASGHFAQLTDHQTDLLREWIANDAPLN